MKMEEQPTHEKVRVPDDEDVYFDVTNDPGSYVPRHWHESIELIFMLEGQLDVAYDHSAFRLKEGDLLLISPMKVHSTKCLFGNRAILTLIPVQFFSRYCEDKDHFHFELNSQIAHDGNREKIEQIKKWLLNMKSSRETRDKISFTIDLLKLCGCLDKSFRDVVNPERLITKAKQQERLMTVIHYTKSHYEEDISLHTIAKLVNLQTEYFCRFFKNQMGVTYINYLHEIRLGAVYKDLITTDEPIGYLLSKHGFTNDKLFRQLFKEKFQTTPSQMRNKWPSRRNGVDFDSLKD